jgi:hypothetical protein
MACIIDDTIARLKTVAAPWTQSALERRGLVTHFVSATPAASARPAGSAADLSSWHPASPQSELPRFSLARNLVSALTLDKEGEPPLLSGEQGEIRT